MHIDKSKLKMGVWYEDKDGNILPADDENSFYPPSNAATFHSQFPLSIGENISVLYDKNMKCHHPIKSRRRIEGLIRGVKGCKCTNCGREKIGKSYIPFAFMPWEYGASSYRIGTFNTHIGRANEKIIMAMVNCGDFTLSEAITVLANACERCMNAIAYKYTNGEEGYAEHSEEWEKANTICEFCKSKTNDNN